MVQADDAELRRRAPAPRPAPCALAPAIAVTCAPCVITTAARACVGVISEHRQCGTALRDIARAPNTARRLATEDGGGKPGSWAPRPAPCALAPAMAITCAPRVNATRWRHGRSTASVGRHGNVERARRYGAMLRSVSQRGWAQEVGASPHARSVCIGPSDGGHTRSLRNCHSSASMR